MGVAEDMAKMVLAADDALNAQTTLINMLRQTDPPVSEAMMAVTERRLERCLESYHSARVKLVGDPADEDAG